MCTDRPDPIGDDMYCIAKQEVVEDVRLYFNTRSTFPLLGKGGQKDLANARRGDADKAYPVPEERRGIHPGKYVGEAYRFERARPAAVIDSHPVALRDALLLSLKMAGDGPPERNPCGILKGDGGKRREKAILVEKRVKDLPRYPVDALFYMDVSDTVMSKRYGRVCYGHLIIDCCGEDYSSILFYGFSQRCIVRRRFCHHDIKGNGICFP